MSSSSRVRVALATPQGPLELRLYDHRHRPVSHGFGRLERRLRPGLYRLEIAAGPTVEQRFLTVGPSGLVDENLTVAMPSAAPVGGASNTHEFHAYPAQSLSRNPTTSFGHGGRLVIFVRDMEEGGRAPVNVNDLALIGPRGEALAVGPGGFDENPDEGWAGLSADVDPGGYTVRLARPRRARKGVTEVVDQSIWVEEDWTTLVFVPYRERVGRPQPEFASVHMAHLWQGFEPYDDDLQGANMALEIALSGLRQGRAAVPREFENLMLRGKFGNPMLGIVGALMLLLGKTNWRLFHTVRRNLRRLVPNHPDLHALHVMAKHKRDDDSNSRIPAAPWPPMLYACYRGLIERDAGERRRLIPSGSTADLAASRLVAQGPWTQWHALEIEPDSERAGAVERQLEHFLKMARTRAQTKGEGALLDQLQKSWTRAVTQLEQPVAKAPRGALESYSYSAMDDPPLEVVQAPELEATPATVRLASYIEGLTAQAADYDMPISDSAFEVRELSEQTGLPRATVERAMKRLAKRGFEF